MSKTKPPARIAMGRTVRPLAQPTEHQRQARRVDISAERAQLARERAQFDRERQEAEANAEHARSCAAIALARGTVAGLDDEQMVLLANMIEAKRQAHVRASKAGKVRGEFRVYDAIGMALHKLRRAALPPAPRNANPLDAALPAPRADAGTYQPKSAAGAAPDRDRDREYRDAQERGRRLREQEQREREAYQDALRRHGLTDPKLGQPGTGGLGY